MNRLLLVFCLIGTLCWTCNRKTTEVTRTPSEIGPIDDTAILPRDSFPSVDIQPALEEVPLYLVAELKRTDCYGGCPAFNAKVYSDGKAEYEGLNNVLRIGKYTANIPLEKLETIYQAAEKANYFVFRNNYPTSGRFMRDLPMTTTYLKRGGLEKRIHNNFDAPLALQGFEQWLEGFFLGLNWEKVVE